MIDAVAVRTPGPLADLAAAVGHLALPADPEFDGERWNVQSGTVAWLASKKSTHTRRAYFRAIAGWTGWCQRTGLDPRRANRGDVDVYTVALAAGTTGTPDAQPLAKSSIAQNLAAISSWYTYLGTIDVTDRNPALHVDRPNIDFDTSTSEGLSLPEARALLDTADADPYRAANRTRALVRVLLYTGMRVSEAIGANIGDLGEQRGHRTLRVVRKGGKVQRLVLPPAAAHQVDVYLAERAADAGLPIDQFDPRLPLFSTEAGGRLDQPYIMRMVRRLCRAAGIAKWRKLSPHDLRHAAATIALDAGEALRDVQDMLGHADPRTTRRYDRSRFSLDRSSSYAIGKALG